MRGLPPGIMPGIWGPAPRILVLAEREPASGLRGAGSQRKKRGRLLPEGAPVSQAQCCVLQAAARVARKRLWTCSQKKYRAGRVLAISGPDPISVLPLLRTHRER